MKVGRCLAAIAIAYVSLVFVGFVAVAAPIVLVFAPFIVLGVFIGSYEWLSRRAEMP